MNDLERLLTGAADQVADAGDAADPAMKRLRAALASRAQEQNLLDIAYRTVETPVGQLLIAATPLGLIRVAYPRQDHDAVLTALAEQVSPRVLFAPAKLDDAARQFDDYFTRHRHRFELAVDLQLASGFRRTVLERLPDVGYGRTVSYGELAAQVGHPRAARAVGTACATNPLPLVIPCHRVVLGDGSPGAYVGGPEKKRVLLDFEHEAAA
ncbi:MAG TPA: methylated-DNA--[protein]-cysteine S-methyltransferase [Streptosporangiaceae bacterium]|jgi:methylated-DNA-[protein]-cysteine S-methyltransferase|nr:methylated-DNA--[protein]-cysteine S-methyltransferase [Streptosporangiaceae bacterium]